MASIVDLPTEIASYICTLLKQSDVSNLTRTSKSIYATIRPILYRHPELASYNSLMLFQRTITRGTWMGRANHRWSTQDGIDQTRYLDLVINPSRDAARNRGQAPAAIMISRMMQAIVRHCPSVDINLSFAHCRCEAAPVSVLATEVFPRVTKLVLYLGKHDPDETHQRRSDSCCGNSQFWDPLVNGNTFPDLKKLEVRHIWATMPPSSASLDLTPMLRASLYRNPPPNLILHSDGLAKLESICLESPPELDSKVFMQLVGNPRAAATNLTNLDLRFCYLNNDTIAQLLYHAPPKLKRLSLILGATDNRDPMNMSTQGPTHLCPLIREYSKRLEILDYGAHKLCQQIFFNEEELQALESSGAMPHGGDNSYEDATTTTTTTVDAYGMKTAIQNCRQEMKKAGRETRIKNAVDTVRRRKIPNRNGIFLPDPSAASVPESKIRYDVERELDDEEERRRQQVTGSRRTWYRRIVAFKSSCQFDEPWAAMQVAADLEEEGIEWILANKSLGVATQHSRGKASVALNYDDVLQEGFQLRER